MSRSWVTLLLLSTLACESEPPWPRPMQASQIAGELALIHRHRILFSHHSVGRNLLSGLQRFGAARSVPLKVMSLEQARSDRGPGLVEISGGQNQQPRSKVDYFADVIRKQALAPELAFMKFCYVDFDPNTDTDAIFEYYKQTLDALRQQFPDIRFAHVTVPLVTQPMALKARVQRLLGRSVWEDLANIKRHEFNQRLIEAYGAEPIFDLARAESTRPDGSRETFEYDGREYYALVPTYTDDDGHLNTAGQDAVAPEMLRFMALALETSTTPPS